MREHQRRRGGKSSAGRVAVKPDDKGAARLSATRRCSRQPSQVLFIGKITAAQPFECSSPVRHQPAITMRVSVILPTTSSVRERGEHHHRGAVLVVVHYRHVEHLSSRCSIKQRAEDVFKVHRTEAAADAHDSLDEIRRGRWCRAQSESSSRRQSA